MENYREVDRCCDYYEKDRIVYEEPHLRQHHHHHNLLNNSSRGDTFRFQGERRIEDKYDRGGHFAGGESKVVTYKVEETDYLFDEAGKDAGHRRQHVRYIY